MHGGTAAGPVTLRTPCTPRTPCTHPLHSQIIKEGALRGCELSYESNPHLGTAEFTAGSPILILLLALILPEPITMIMTSDIHLMPLPDLLSAFRTATCLRPESS